MPRRLVFVLLMLSTTTALLGHTVAVDNNVTEERVTEERVTEERVSEEYVTEEYVTEERATEERVTGRVEMNLGEQQWTVQPIRSDGTADGAPVPVTMPGDILAALERADRLGLHSMPMQVELFSASALWSTRS
jgi:hypothetical protein